MNVKRRHGDIIETSPKMTRKRIKHSYFKIILGIMDHRQNEDIRKELGVEDTVTKIESYQKQF